MRILFVPLFSMRSYLSGRYSVLKDGNFQLAMARALTLSAHHDVTVITPDKIEDWEDFYIKANYLKHANNIQFTPLTYGTNAVDTRKTFWHENYNVLKPIINNYDLVITDITGFPFDVKFINNFNISKIKELDRPYIDPFFETDLISAEKSILTTVLNYTQERYLSLKGVNKPVWTCHYVLNEKWYQLFSDDDTYCHLFDDKTIFLPFRISDKAYRIDELVNYILTNLPDYKVIITDPNDSAYLSDKIIKIKPTKEQYYTILKKCRPIVVMLDDADLVFHPGTAEFMMFGCRLITLTNTTLWNINQITDLHDLSDMISHCEYDGIDTSIRRFGNGDLYLSVIEEYTNE